MAAMSGRLRHFGATASSVRRSGVTICQRRGFISSSWGAERDSVPLGCTRSQPASISGSRYPSSFFATSKRAFSSDSSDHGEEKDSETETATATTDNFVRLSKLLSQHSKSLAISRREAERLIKGGDVTVAGETITSPHFLVNWDDLLDTIQTPGIVKVSGKAVALVPPHNSNNTNTTSTENSDEHRKIWIVHKLKGEVVADHDQQGRPSMMERLIRSGVGKAGKGARAHIKPIGRLDMTTEGLILVTTCGTYAREMEYPGNQFHRSYRVRVHGPLTRYKIQAIQRGISIRGGGRNDNYTDSNTTVTVAGGKAPIRYGPMKVDIEGGKGRKRPGTSTNSWIKITCTEGKNRQIRNVLQYLGLTVTRLIRVSFGDYQLQDIPPGMALEVPIKDLKKQVHKGPLFASRQNRKRKQAADAKAEAKASPIQWVRHYR